MVIFLVSDKTALICVDAFVRKFIEINVFFHSEVKSIAGFS